MGGLMPQQYAPKHLPSTIRWLLIGAIPGLVAGVIVAGGGSRIAMRIVGAVEGRVPQQESDLGFIVGEPTAFGTIFLVLIFGSAVGLVGGLFYMCVRPWLGGRRRWRGPLFAAILLLAGGGIVIEVGNTDFSRFGSPALNIFLFGGLFILFGLVVAPLVEWTDTRLKLESSDRPMHEVGYAMIGIGYLVVAVPLVLISLFVFTGLIDNPVKIIIPALLISLIPLGYASGSGIQMSATHGSTRAFQAGYGILGIACLLGLFFGVQAVIDIQDCSELVSSRARGFAPTEELASALCR